MRLGVDVGGTFTDMVLYDEDSGHFTAKKCILEMERDACVIDETLSVQ